ncbi:ComEA family DNA-binding protein [Pseudidiomarina andamanensis]|uniref:Helix-hairpin-helix domain-containing protein n=1 Tax=Pseudidiomarina andamanensis TaxID=1940690 RepID=A0AA92ES59_9GAMM|nr:helix-hairpin-helix domain-containing protein [Pseudidiomarina andamanensis]MDS0218409.1 helix-hairpin-helix domain-containing protein [Pseudidiomarina andamanensis]QGT95291.1 helix-hairpin-helix domain-containing protein [Pseudidiomarina andamanensis]
MLRKTLIFTSMLAPLVMLSPSQAAAMVAPIQAASQTAGININTADAEQLAYALTGVGIKRAKDIVKLREELGQFTDINQLMQVKGIGPRMLELNKDRIVL